MSGADDVVVANSDVGAFLFFFVWFIFTDHFGVCDLSPAVRWDIIKTDDMKSFCAFHPLLCAGGILSNALVETSKFVSVRRVPDVPIFRMVMESTVFK